MTVTRDMSDEWWSSTAIRVSDRTDVFEEAMSAAYRPIEITRRLSVGFESKLRMREFDGLSLVECLSDPCSGRRHKSAIKADAPSFGIQIIHSGAERIRVGKETFVAHSGDVIVWRSDTPYEFEVVEPMRKTTLVMPWSEIETRVPRANQFLGTRTTTANGVGLLVGGLMRQMVEHHDDICAGSRSGVRSVFIAASVALLDGITRDHERTLSDCYFEQIQQYILENLHDSALTVEKIAQSQRMSVRYIHKLFEKSSFSVSGYVTALRLSRCKEALGDSCNSGLNVMDIANLWGYTDASTFNKVFKREYGISPGKFRSRTAEGLIRS